MSTSSTVLRFALVGAATVVCALASPARAAGVLVPRDGRASVTLRSQRVQAELDDGLARTTVRQTFVSPHAGALEAIYIFPVPDGATLVDVAMEVGGQRLEGLVVERQAARRIYDDIVRSKRDPALVEQVGRNSFRLSVFPVVQGAETVVELTWIQQAPLRGGAYHYVYPLALAGDSTTTEHDLTFTLRVKSSAPLVEVSSPTADMAVTVRDPHEALASFERHHARLDTDLVVDAKVRAPQASLGVRSFLAADGTTYLAAVVTPPAATAEDAIPRDVTLLLDCSGSMNGEKIVQARAAAQFLVDNARAIDRVNVVRFNAAVDAFADTPQTMTAANRAALATFVAATSSGGSTALADALDFALAQPVTPGRVSTVVLLTDGRPTVGVTSSTAIVGAAKAAAPRGARVFTFGVGADLDEGLLRGIAAATRGTAEVFRPGGEIEDRLSAFLSRTATPLLADVRLEADGARLIETYPRPIPDIYLGEQMVLTTRVRGNVPSTLTVRTQVGSRRITLSASVPQRTAPGGDSAVRQDFARQKIDFLEEALRLRNGLGDAAYYAALDRGAYDTADEIVAEIVTTSIECGVQSAYASFLVLLPEDRQRIDPRNLDALREARGRAAAARREAAGDLPDPAEQTAANGDAPNRPVEEAGEQAEDPVVKDAQVSDHNETDSDMDDSAALGDPRFDSDAPFEGPAENGTVGIGGGAGGAFGGRRGGRRTLKAGGGGHRTQTACDSALEWMQATQRADGSWEGPAGAEPGVTGTVLLTFLGAGETHSAGQYKDVVKRGLAYLKIVQDPDGWFGPRASDHAIFNQTRAALALTEAYGLTGSRLFKGAATRAVDALRTHPEIQEWWTGRSESEAAWIVLLAKSADMADLTDATWSRDLAVQALRVLDNSTGALPRARDAALLALALTGHPETADRVEKEAFVLPSWDEGRMDPDLVQRRTLICFQVGGRTWERWNEAVKATVVDHQTTDTASGDRRGYWEIVPSVTARGRAHDAALCDLVLEVYYRYGRVVGASSR